MVRDGTCLHTIDGRAERGAVLCVGVGPRLRRKIKDAGAKAGEDRSGMPAGEEGHLVLLRNYKVLSACSRMIVVVVVVLSDEGEAGCDRKALTSASPRSLPRPRTYLLNQRNMLRLLMEMMVCSVSIFVC